MTGRDVRSDADFFTRDGVNRMMQESWQEWSSYAKVAKSRSSLPRCCTSLKDLLFTVPAYPRKCNSDRGSISRLVVQHESPGSLDAQAYCSGQSSWTTSSARCDLPVKHLRCKILYGNQRTTVCEFDQKSSFSAWPGIDDEDTGSHNSNHIGIAVLAWAYIFSALWLELQESSHPISDLHVLAYTDIAAEETRVKDDDKIEALQIHVETASLRKARWWRAILANGEGWTAIRKINESVYKSPWSAHARTRLPVIVQTCPTSDASENTSALSPPSAEEALGFLADYCVQHGIYYQCMAALATVMYLPWKSEQQQSLRLPIPRSYSSRSSSTSSPVARDRIMEEWHHLRYYMTLSCNTWGLKAILHSAFYDHKVSCDLVSSWLSPIFQVLDPLIDDQDYTSFVSILAIRTKHVAPLWLGAVLSGLQAHILRDVKNGLTAIELHSTTWTCTDQTFVTSPDIVFDTDSEHDQGLMSRQRECRLLFFTGYDGHERVPAWPFKPFGAIPLQSLDFPVRAHMNCRHHVLRYSSWAWDVEGSENSPDDGLRNKYDNVLGDLHHTGIMRNDNSSLKTFQTFDKDECTTIDFDISEEDLSRRFTTGIFAWLRNDGICREEKGLFEHEWWIPDFDESEEEEEDVEQSAEEDGDQVGTSIKVRQWREHIEPLE